MGYEQGLYSELPTSRPGVPSQVNPGYSDSRSRPGAPSKANPAYEEVPETSREGSQANPQYVTSSHHANDPYAGVGDRGGAGISNYTEMPASPGAESSYSDLPPSSPGAASGDGGYVDVDTTVEAGKYVELAAIPKPQAGATGSSDVYLDFNVGD